MDDVPPWKQLVDVARAAARAEVRAKQLAEQRDRLIIELCLSGETQQTVADLARLSRQRVSQVMGKYLKQQGDKSP